MESDIEALNAHRIVWRESYPCESLFHPPELISIGNRDSVLSQVRCLMIRLRLNEILTAKPESRAPEYTAGFIEGFLGQ